MAFHHRKLLNASISDPGIGNTCAPYCDFAKNPNPCPVACVAFCYGSCIPDIPGIKVLPPLPSPEIDNSDEPHKHQKLHLFLPILIAVLTAGFLVFACYTIYKFWYGRRRRRSGRPEEGGPVSDEFLDADLGPVVDHPIWYIRTVGLQPAVISAITIVRYKRGDGIIEGTDCSVCLNEFQEDETLRLLPKCNHAFHIPCIDTWLRSHTNCPLCRAGIVNNPSAFATVSTPSELGFQNSRPAENPTTASLDFRRVSENEGLETRAAVEDDEGGSGAETGINVDEILGKEEANIIAGGLDGIQPMRRSVSLDSLSASVINEAVVNATETKHSNVENDLRFVGSPSVGRSLQIGSSSVKRSLSCSAKVFLSRHSSNTRSRNSVLPQ